MLSSMLIPIIAQVAEAVFNQVYIPNSLDAVHDFERDINAVRSGAGKDVSWRFAVFIK